MKGYFNGLYEPIPNAGPDQSVTAGSQVTLDGSQSKVYGNLAKYGRELTQYEWVQIDSNRPVILHGNGPNPTFTVPGDADGSTRYHFNLLVRDNGGYISSNPDDVYINLLGKSNKQGLLPDRGSISSESAEQQLPSRSEPLPPVTPEQLLCEDGSLPNADGACGEGPQPQPLLENSSVPIAEQLAFANTSEKIQPP